MSTTQELITPAALNYIANETACQLDDPLHAERLRTLIPDALRQAADRLASLSAELDALKAKLAGVVRFAEHIAKQPLAEQCHKDHEDEAALADLALDYLHLAQPEFCSARCPSVGREGEAIPHLPECVSMRSLLDGLPFATPGATISTGLMAKLKKLANYLTEQGEYEACDLIDTVVDRLTATPPAPAQEPRK